VASQPKWGLGHLIFEVPGSHTIGYTHPVELLSMSDQPVAEAANYTTHNKHKRKIHVFGGIGTLSPLALEFSFKF
jgi:hypothetical protein